MVAQDSMHQEQDRMLEQEGVLKKGRAQETERQRAIQ